MSEHPGEQFPAEVDPDVEPGSDPYRSEEVPAEPDYDTEPGSQNQAEQQSHSQNPSQAEHQNQSQDQSLAESQDQAEPGERLDPAEVEFGPEFARAPGEEHEHSFEAGSAETQPGEQYADEQPGEQGEEMQGEGGHPLVEETMGRLDGLRDRAVGEHAEVYADLHERLQSALVEADADQGDRG
ncbi:hypothetical protein [Kribbella solani]|uniref:Uncharacterized protein n=1 Tax=Kribbella solani TaxID=236067 RepID=A0A841DIQ8_9ACTN|nr:hypothetical protein [Kribbella solani]MBB5976666.1 hypothetical protein [Kribbella solani]